MRARPQGKRLSFLLVALGVVASMMIPPQASAWTTQDNADAVLIGPDNKPRVAECGGNDQSIVGYEPDGVQGFSIENTSNRYIDTGCANWMAATTYEEATTTIDASGMTVVTARQSENSVFNDKIRMYDSGGNFVWEYEAKDECDQPAQITARPVVNGGIATYLYRSCQNNDLVIRGVNIITQQQVFDAVLGSLDPVTYLSWYVGGFIVVDTLGGTIRFIALSGVEDASKSVSIPWNSHTTTHPDGTVIYTSSDPTDSSLCYINFDRLNGPTLQRLIVCGVYDEYGSFIALPSGDVVAVSNTPDENGNSIVRIIHQATATDTVTKIPKPSKARDNTFGSLWLTVDANGKIVVGSVYQETLGAWPYATIVSRTAVDVLNQYGRRESRWLSSVLGDTDFRQYTNGIAYQLANGALYLLDAEMNQLEKVELPGVSIGYRDSVRWNIQPVALAQQLNYVALGDSFSSGEGVEPFIAGTDTSTNECHRSEDAYPELLAMDPSLDLSLTDFVACSGATTNDVLGIHEDDDSHGSWDGSAQVNALSAETDMVTITIGGNDIRFSDFATECLFPVDTYIGHEGVCDEFTPIYTETKSKIDSTLEGRLRAVYSKILSEAPNATVYVVGYPRISPYKLVTDEFDQKCGGLYDAWPNNWGDARAAYEIVELLNNKIQGAISTVSQDHTTDRLKYVSTYDGAFTGHDACSEDSYFNGIVWPNNTEYSIHPNASGHAAYQRDLKEAIN